MSKHENKSPVEAENPQTEQNLSTEVDIDIAVQQFADAIESEFGIPVEPEPDGTIHRFHDPEGKSSNQAGWYYMDETAAEGVFGSWRRDGKIRWISPEFNTLSATARGSITQRIQEAIERDAAVRVQRQNEVALKAEAKYSKARPASASHPYLERKGIGAGVAHLHGNKLLIPMQNASGSFRNIQSISPKGNKRFMPGGEVKGNFVLIGELPDTGRIYITEGYATAVTVHQELGTPVVAAMNAGNLLHVAKALREALPKSVEVIFAADDDRGNPDNPGLNKAILAAKAINATVIAPNFAESGCTGTDFNDLANWKGRDTTAALFRAVELDLPPTSTSPRPIKPQLPPVLPLTEAMLPASFVGFVTDTATRLQIAPDYIVAVAISMAAGMVGAKVGIHPKQRDSWLVIATIWAGLIGAPSTMKSAALTEGKKPVDTLERELAEAYDKACTFFDIDSKLSEGNLKQVEKTATKLYTTDPEKARQDVLDATFDEPRPLRFRYLINDATVEKCGEIMSENPHGLLQVRDELSGWMSKMSRDEFQSDRAFYLECYDGNSRFTWDRIGRGTIEIENCTLSICGGIQPSKLAPLIHGAINGSTDDGLIQRFQLAVWPDIQGTWKWTDQLPNAAAYQQYEDAIRALHELVGPSSENHIGHLRFSEQAQAAYQAWMESLYGRIRSTNMHPVMQSHMAKMPKTIASLALLFELIDGGRTEVGVKATTKALLWSDYLESHANRLYSLADDRGTNAAKLILDRREKLPASFTARDIQRKHWTGLATHQDLLNALELLIEHGHLLETRKTSGSSGGRPMTLYSWHPSLTKKT